MGSSDGEDVAAVGWALGPEVGNEIDGEGVGGPRHIWKCPKVSGKAQKDISTLVGGKI